MRIGDQLEYFAVLHGAFHVEGRAATRAWLERLGLGERVSARVEELSHGNQQRVDDVGREDSADHGHLRSRRALPGTRSRKDLPV